VRPTPAKRILRTTTHATHELTVRGHILRQSTEEFGVDGRLVWTCARGGVRVSGRRSRETDEPRREQTPHETGIVNQMGGRADCGRTKTHDRRPHAHGRRAPPEGRFIGAEAAQVARV
jgi:hypothetical protein